MKHVLICCVRIYQVVLSPLMGGQCRYYPSCSHYAIDALREHGAWKGGIMAAKRLLRCHPLAKGGYDPVPPGASKLCTRSTSSSQPSNSPQSASGANRQ